MAGIGQVPNLPGSIPMHMHVLYINDGWSQRGFACVMSIAFLRHNPHNACRLRLVTATVDVEPVP